MNTYDGVLAFAAQYPVYAEGAFTPLELELLILCWFNAMDFGAAIALILTMSFSQARAQEFLLIRGFTPYYQMYAEPLPSDADAFTGQLVMDLPALDELIRKAPVLSS